MNMVFITQDYFSTNSSFQVGNIYVIVDCGGGTVVSGINCFD